MPELLIDRPTSAGGEAGVDGLGGLDRIGLALADPIRRAVLVRLLDGAQCPSDLAAEIGTSRSNLSNHLACLRGERRDAMDERWAASTIHLHMRLRRAKDVEPFVRKRLGRSLALHFAGGEAALDDV